MPQKTQLSRVVTHGHYAESFEAEHEEEIYDAKKESLVRSMLEEIGEDPSREGRAQETHPGPHGHGEHPQPDGATDDPEPVRPQGHPDAHLPRAPTHGRRGHRVDAHEAQDQGEGETP